MKHLAVEISYFMMPYPNSLPRVGGIITSVIQTPLSHVNLRAIQDDVPNAYIADPLSINEIASLLNGYIYYKVENDSYEIREATLAEVNDWYENIRPTEPQFPIRDLSFTEILPLDVIDFEMSTAFGAKCSNVSTMRTFEFPNGTIPDGFGVPFYYYDEFMQFNNFYEEVQVMIENPSFQNDINFRVNRLEELRTAIKDAPMPQWMLDDFQAMHDAFPEGTAVRVRSSTNNEDLPGFSGAGLYTSKTQYPDEGHIKKSVKQVYASMWNFRAYEERDFYRIDHFTAAMGLLCHPNFQQEQSNGVGISIDPIYETEDTFYLNTQIGESLITNPDPNSAPEEILLYRDPSQSGGYLVLRLSNLVNAGELIMDEEYLNQMRDYLTVIHDEFATLYGVAEQEDFAMDIEYKVTAQNQLAIKQARPWVSFWADIVGDFDLGVEGITNPITSSGLGDSELVTVAISNNGLNEMSNFDIELMFNGLPLETITISETIEPFNEAAFQFSAPIDLSNNGDYDITVNISHPDDVYENNNSLTVTVSNILEFDGALEIENLRVLCDEIVEIDLTVSNLGDTIINEIEIETLVNGFSSLVNYESLDIPFSEQETITLILDQSLQASNEITIDLMSVNNQVDENSINDSVSTTTSLDSSYDTITFIINPDDWPQETSWKLYDNNTNEVISAGSLDSGSEYYAEEICVNYESCFTLDVFDSYGDGICCGYGEGNFMMLSSSGSVIFENDGVFENFTQETFCLGENACEIAAEINITNTSSEDSDDGYISIDVSSGVGPFQYSIDGGQTFFETSSFTDLSAGDYNISVIGSAGACTFEQYITIESCSLTTVDFEVVGVPSSISTDGSITIMPTSGVGPYQYSIDGGQNFYENNFFEELPSGLYNIVVNDSQEICSFEESVRIEIESVIINEINYRSHEEFNPSDWLELYNPKSYAIDLSDWQIRDDNNNHIYNIPESTIIEPEGFLVVIRDESDFSAAFPEIPFIGELGFGLGDSDDGYISIVVSSGVGPFQYSIDAGQTFFETSSFTDLSAGDYNISIIGSAGICTFEQNITIESCSLTTVDFEVAGVVSSISTDGSITIIPTSGVGPYQYSIDGGQNFYENNFFEELPSGLYNIVVNDSQEICSFEDSVRIEIESVIINEINYRSHEDFTPNDWIELYNPKSYQIDLSDWQIRDDNNNHIYNIPEATIIEPEGFLVVVRDESDFSAAFPEIPFIAELGFGLGGSDAVRLFNSESKLIDEVYYDIENSSPNCEHTLNMIDSYGDGWNGNSVSVVVNGEIVVEEASFDDGYFENILFDTSQGDSIELIWFAGSWEEEVSFEILDGAGNIISFGQFGDTLEDQNVLANCFENISDWPICADGTGYTLELINPNLDNFIAENWDCINEFGSPNAPNNSNLSAPQIFESDSIKIYPNPVNDILNISGRSEKYNIEIYSLTGQKLYQDLNVSKIDMSLYSDGIYIIKISNQNSTSTKRVIKIN